MANEAHSAQNEGLLLAASLALVAVLGPSAIDMYLSSMPRMAQDLHTSYANVQLSLTVFLLAMGAGQLLFGPISDALGRRRPLLVGILAFIAASIWSANAGSIEELLYSRLIQGLCAAMTLVVVMSTVRDVAKGTRATQLFALLMTIQGLAPVLAPALGGFIEVHYGWRGVMLVLAGLGVLALANSFFSLPETLPVEQRLSPHPLNIARTYWHIASNGSFLLPALALSAAFFLLFTYIGGAPLVYQHDHGLSPDTFGLVFGATGSAILAGAMASGRLVKRIRMPRLALIGTLLMVIGTSLACLSSLLSFGLVGIVAGLFIAMLGLGIAEATLMSLAMSSQHSALGSTAALLGAMQLVIASAATPLAGALAEVGTLQWLAFLALVAIVVLGLTIASNNHCPRVTNQPAAH